MARTFAGSADALYSTVLWSTATTDFTFAAWVKLVSANGSVFCTGVDNGVSPTTGLRVNFTGGGNWQFILNGISVHDSGIAAALGQWVHVAVVRSNSANGSMAATRTYILIDGVLGSPNPNATPNTPTTACAIGARPNDGTGTSFAEFLDGAVAEFGVWEAALSQTEIQALAAGAVPSQVRPASLKVYLPLIGRLSPESDLSGRTPMTLIGSPGVEPHPRTAVRARLLPQIQTNGVAIHNKSITQGINFTHQLAPQGWVTRNISAGSVTAISGGGRQIIRGANNRLWHCYYEGETRVAYSDDEGVTWTVVGIGTTWVPAGMCLSQGASNNPVLILTRPSNDDFYIYQWNGSSFVLKKQLNEPVNASEAFQVVYTGSIYLLVYGYVTSTNDRRVYSRTSSDLVTWSSATLVKNGDGSGTGVHKYRRLAACLDVSGNVHLIYSIRSGGSHKLYYRKYSSGAWGTEETIVTGGSGNNISDYQSGLSIAVDDQGVVHAAARVKNTSYTSRVKIVYYQRSTGGTWTAEDVHTQVDGDQGFPSLSLNGRRPSIIWDSAGLGLGTVRGQRAADGSSWAYSTIYGTTKSNAQSVHGPSYGSTYNYSRGQVGSVTGSEEYFSSSDAVPGTAAYMENSINFSGILSTLRRVMSNTITFAGTLLGVRSLGLTSTLVFDHCLNFAREKTLESTLEFRQVLGGTTATVIINQTLNFTDTLVGVKDPTKVITHTITFTDNLTQTRSASMATEMQLASVLTANIHKQVSIVQTLNFAPTLGLNFSLKKLLTNVLNFVQGLIAFKADEGCEPSFTPERTIAGENDVSFVYLIGPLPTLDLSVQLKRPEYGNARRQALQVKVNRTRGGKLRLHAKSPTYEPQTMTFADLTYLKLEQIRNFLRVTKGKKVYYIDERNRKWVGYLTSSDVDLSDEAHQNGGTFTVDFEGSLV